MPEESKIIAAWSIKQIILTEEYFWAFIRNWTDQSETRFNNRTYSIVPLMNYFIIFSIYSKTLRYNLRKGTRTKMARLWLCRLGRKALPNTINLPDQWRCILTISWSISEISPNSSHCRKIFHSDEFILILTKFNLTVFYYHLYLCASKKLTLLWFWSTLISCKVFRRHFRLVFWLDWVSRAILKKLKASVGSFSSFSADFWFWRTFSAE